MQGGTRRPDTLAPMLELLVTVGLPCATFLVLRQFGVGIVAALGLGAIFPAAVVLHALVRRGRPDPLGLLILGASAVGIGAALLSGNPFFALIRESFVSLSIGLAFLVSLAMPRPLVFTIARGSMARDDAAELAFDRAWENAPQLRVITRRLSLAWGLFLVSEATARAIILHAWPTGTAWATLQIVLGTLSAALTLASFRYGMQQRDRFAGEAAVSRSARSGAPGCGPAGSSGQSAR